MVVTQAQQLRLVSQVHLHLDGSRSDVVGRVHAGFFFGRTPLIALSPKKTWEGFVGGALLTLVASWYLARYMSRFPWMICERNVSGCSVLGCELFLHHRDSLPPHVCIVHGA